MPAVTFAGIGSGMDIETLIEGLVSIERQPISRIESRAASVRSAVTSLSNVGGLLSKLNSTVSALDTLQEVGSYRASSSNADAVALTANGNAQPGTYNVRVVDLAQADRRYSDTFSAANTALGLEGSLTLRIGDVALEGGGFEPGDEEVVLDIEAIDTLDGLIQKINDSGLRVQASAFYDGSQYRLQLRGLDTGAENNLTVEQSGFDLGLNQEANIIQTAQNARVEIDGFAVESSTNQISQAISGVTFALKQETTDAFEVRVESDSAQLGEKLQGFVNSYNAVIREIHTASGFGQRAASNPILAGDSTLRRITNELSNAVTRTFGDETENTLAALGIRLNNDGTLRLDQSRLNTLLSEDPSAIGTILSGDDTTDGAMDALRELTKSLTAPDTGALEIRKDGLNSRAQNLEDQIAREEARLVSTEERLRKTFTQMDSTVAAYNAQLQYLISQS